MAKMTEETIARIVAEQMAVFMAAQNGATTTALVADRAAPVKASTQDDDTETVRGILTYVAMHGNGAQLDGETVGEKDADCEWFNAKKGKTPFAAIKLGSTVDVTYATLTDDQGRSRNRVVSVETVKAGKGTPKQNATAGKQTEKPAEDMVNISGLAVRGSAPTTQNPNGCKRCGGAKHGKNGQGTILSECAQAQYVKATGASFKPHKAASVAQYAAWLDAHQIVVATTYDGEKAARIGGENELSTTVRTHNPKTAPEIEQPEKRKPGRPKGSGKQAAKQQAAPQASTLTGKLLRVNNAGTKIQLQPKGEKFQWLDVDAGVKIKDSWLGKSLLVTLNDGTVTVATRAPKA